MIVSSNTSFQGRLVNDANNSAVSWLTVEPRDRDGDLQHVFVEYDGAQRHRSVRRPGNCGHTEQ